MQDRTKEVKIETETEQEQEQQRERERTRVKRLFRLAISTANRTIRLAVPKSLERSSCDL